MFLLHLRLTFDIFKSYWQQWLSFSSGYFKWQSRENTGNSQDKQNGAEKNTNSLLAAGLFALRSTAVISQLCTKAKWEGRIAVVNAHHSNLFIWRTLSLATNTALRLNRKTIHSRSKQNVKTQSQKHNMHSASSIVYITQWFTRLEK